MSLDSMKATEDARRTEEFDFTKWLETHRKSTEHNVYAPSPTVFCALCFPNGTECDDRFCECGLSKGRSTVCVKCGKPYATLEQIKDRLRYELRDPALPETTVSEMTALLNSHDEQERHLKNTLARIHRDGGHYIDQHGIEKAVKDADSIVANLYGELDDLRTENRRMRRGLGYAKKIPHDVLRRAITGSDAQEVIEVTMEFGD